MDRTSYFLKDLLTRAGQNGLIRIVNDIAGGDVRFLHVGAGAHADPLRDLIRHHRWRGAMVEPVPVLWNQLQQTYAGFEEVQFVQAVCAEAPATLEFCQVRRIDEMTWDGMRGLSSLDRFVTRAHFQSDAQFEHFIETVTVDVVTVDSLLDRLEMTRLDIVVIEALGAGHRVLRGFDVERYRPKLLILEQRHLAAETCARIDARMSVAGYRRFVGVLDTTYYLPEHFRPDELPVLLPFEAPFLALG
jgi:FkbM family methyltransferase